MRRLLLALVMALMAAPLAILATAGVASAHVERPSYWPDPKPDCSVAPCAGGKVPTMRSLASSLDTSKPGVTRVVCHTDSMTRLRAAISKARSHGYNDRPTAHHSFSAAQASALLRINSRLFKMCRYRQIQPAVTASHNNDRVVVMPGLYLEPTARKQPTHDPRCAAYRTKSDSGDPGAVSHNYQLKCPNDANLVAVIGRGLDTGPVPDPPLTNRHGIPHVGKCIRCNFQLEGSGVSADDVVLDAGDWRKGNKGPSAVGHKKDVGVFVDRADGFVLRKMTVRHAREHDIYAMETDGYVLDRFKTFYAGGYGVLTFVEDHGLVQNCEAAGNGDSGLYPGSGADTTDKRYLPFYPKYRYSQVFRYCDSHHNTGGFSGTNSHGTLITHNNFYDNSLGFTTDVFTAPGHPGYPQHGNVVDNNNFYNNNFNAFTTTSDVAPFIAAPVGTGLWFAGGNANQLTNNHFYDNYRRGVMLFAVPDATVCGPPPVGSSTPVPGCDPTKVSTSYNNKFHGNTMGMTPSGRVAPNGVDFWWDSFPATTGNCWWGNKAAPGKSVTSSPANLPNCANGTAPGTSIGLGDVANEGELAACLAGFTVVGYPNGDPNTCTWTKTPAKPASSSARTTSTGVSSTGNTSSQGETFSQICDSGLAPRTCAPYAGILTRTFGPAISASQSVSPQMLVHPIDTVGPLGTFTCSWWRQSDAEHRLGMVRRISRYATKPIDGPTAYGFGAGLSDQQATTLFENRCSTFGAGPFALYKIYGSAAPFAAFTQ